jgi:hypothetical protein
VSPEHHEVYLIYGSCTHAGGEGGCPAPLDVQISPSCARSLWLYARYSGARNDAERRRRLAQLRRRLVGRRGVPAYELGERTELYSGALTIVVHGARGIRDAAIDRLAAMDGGRPRAGEPLPPPTPGAIAGLLDCDGRPAAG